MIVIQKSHIKSAIVLISIFLLITFPSPIIVRSQSDEVIGACTRQVGTLQELTMLVIADSCEEGWTPIKWNVQGPQGEPGPAGANGKDGAPGPAWKPTITFSERLISNKIKNELLGSHLACFLSLSGARHQNQACTCEVAQENGNWYLKMDLDESVEKGYCNCQAMCMD